MTDRFSWPGLSILFRKEWGRSGVSDEAREIAQATSIVAETAEQSQALFGAKAAALAELRSMAEECAQEGWDGDGASPIDPQALANAENFLRILPEGLPLPECAPDPDGSISLDWIRSQHRFLSLSVGTSNRLSNASLHGSDRNYGVVRFDGDEVPDRLVLDIESLMGNGETSVRTA